MGKQGSKAVINGHEPRKRLRRDGGMRVQGKKSRGIRFEVETGTRYRNDQGWGGV